MPRQRAWVEYVEQKFGVSLRGRDVRLDLDPLVATQSEIERIKYDLVRHEGFRIHDPILAFRAPYGDPFVVDGHTRARVLWDMGEKAVAAVLYASASWDVYAELLRIATECGEGRPRLIGEVPIVDRLGPGTDAWRARREELLAEWAGRADAAGSA